MPLEAPKEDYEPLEMVTTLAGAVRLTGEYRNTISYAIDAGNIAAQRDGAIVLVSIPSLLRWKSQIDNKRKKWSSVA
jgi:Tfp pilus assembly major pilin PilA